MQTFYAIKLPCWAHFSFNYTEYEIIRFFSKILFNFGTGD